MKGGIFNTPECCNQPCECPVCFENKPLMRLNCNHYVCLEDIQNIINSNQRRLQKCPICRTLITNYGCNGNIINVGPNIIPNEEGYDTDTQNGVDDEGYDTDDTVPLYGGRKRKTNRTRKNKKRKLNKRKLNGRKTIRKYKISKKKDKQKGSGLHR